jgi:hypothetical protein
MMIFFSILYVIFCLEHAEMQGNKSDIPLQEILSKFICLFHLYSFLHELMTALYSYGTSIFFSVIKFHTFRKSITKFTENNEINT